jgi:hypothetical protein
MTLLNSISRFLNPKRSRPTATIGPPQFSGIGTVLISHLVGLDFGSDAAPGTLAAIYNRVFECVTRHLMESDVLIAHSGDVIAGCWGPIHTVPSHASLAFVCGKRILRSIAAINRDLDFPAHVRLALGTGQMTTAAIAQRLQCVGIAPSTANRLADVNLPKRTSMLYTRETLDHVPEVRNISAPVSRIQRATGEEIDVFELLPIDS